MCVIENDPKVILRIICGKESSTYEGPEENVSLATFVCKEGFILKGIENKINKLNYITFKCSTTEDITKWGEKELQIEEYICLLKVNNSKGKMGKTIYK